MGQHTTDEVYDKLADVEETIDANAKSTVTTTNFDAKIKDLKAAIESGGKKEEEPQGWKDLAKEMSPIKDILAVANGSDFLSKAILTFGAITATVAAVTAIIASVKGLMEKFKSLSLTVSGRLTGNRQYIGRDADGHLGIQPENPQQSVRQLQRAANQQLRQRRQQSGASGLPSSAEANSLGQAIGRINNGITTLDGLKSKLPTAAKMKRTATAANKLSDALEKITERLRPADLDNLTDATGRLNQKMSAFDHDKLPKPRTLKDIASAAREVVRDGDRLRVLFQELGTDSTDAANRIAG